MRAAEAVSLLQPDQVAPCSSNPPLFERIDYRAHLEAREACLGCSIRLGCLEVGQADRQASGTYGGVLFMQGRRILEIR